MCLEGNFGSVIVNRWIETGPIGTFSAYCLRNHDSPPLVHVIPEDIGMIVSVGGRKILCQGMKHHEPAICGNLGCITVAVWARSIQSYGQVPCSGGRYVFENNPSNVSIKRFVGNEQAVLI